MLNMKKNKITSTEASYNDDENIYTINDINDIITEYKTIKTNKKIEYFNIPAAFDIETSSFHTDGKKQTCMYMWSFGINGHVIVGRTWEEFLELMTAIQNRLELSVTRRLIVYCHNLAMEFQFIRKWLKWENVFAVKERKPVKALATNGFEFRCSYILSAKSLAKLGDDLLKYKVSKMVGDLDYRKIRHTKTPITDKELRYSANDVRVVMAYIQECIEDEGNITQIPLTQTGYVRRYCRNACLFNEIKRQSRNKTKKYRSIIRRLTIEPKEYLLLRRAFQGGFTHTNAFYSGEVIKNVSSYDITSSYPTVMVSEQFPMTKGKYINVTSEEQFRRLIRYYCCVFTIEFIGLNSIQMCENPLSSSHCSTLEGASIDNGRVVECTRCITSITEQDFFIFEKFYEWKSFRILELVKYNRGYLPTDFVKSILKLYEDKTTLKNVDGKEKEYAAAKSRLNSIYGMTCQDVLNNDSVYLNDEWQAPEPPVLEDVIAKYNKSYNRFTYYPWALYVTAYARRRLFGAILECGNDYIYSDTDSVKIKNGKAHAEYFAEADRIITQRINDALTYHKIPLNTACPKSPDGKVKPLGVWDFEGEYEKFKALRAKAYMVWKKDVLKIGKKKYNVSLTVSGIQKTVAIPYMIEQYGYRGVFEAFSDNMYIPPERTGKLTHTYIDDDMHGTVADYTGVSCDYYEKSGIHLEPCDYSLSLTEQYINYIKGIREFSK